MKELIDVLRGLRSYVNDATLELEDYSHLEEYSDIIDVLDGFYNDVSDLLRRVAENYPE